MFALITRFAQAVTRLSSRNVERLWVHYCAALFVVIGLVGVTHVLLGGFLARSLALSDGVASTTAHVIAGKDILLEAERLATSQVTTLDRYLELVGALEAAQNDYYTASATWTDAPIAQTAVVHAAMAEFSETARLFANVASVDRPAVWAELSAQFIYAGLQRETLATARALSTGLADRADRLATVQLAIIAASATVLLAEALLIFWPAHKAVRTTISKMRRQAITLQHSQKRLQETNARLDHLAKHDALTGLQNRTAMNERLAAALLSGRIEGGALLFVGIDNFKAVNANYGHQIGDQLLVEVGQILRSCVDEDHMIARVGGDEFSILTDENVNSVLKRIENTMLDPINVDGRRILVNITIGHLILSDMTRGAADLLDDAEFAMRYAKERGGNRALAYAPKLREEAGLLQELQIELPAAIRNGEIEPWFQPQVRLDNGHLHGAEVLARWRHPSRGLLTPDVFLPAAERAGLIVDLDHAIWIAAMQMARQWRDEDLWRPKISINAAPETIADPLLIERFLLAIQRNALEADQVVIEILEDTLIDSKDDMAAINIDTLAECGIKLELDDFGTGYGMLSKLVQLPIAGIKLDRSLVSLLPDQATDSVIRAILALATELGLHVVAEGIEENAQAIQLTERGCSFGQGYGFGRPMAPDVFAEWLREHGSGGVGFSGMSTPDVARA
ncbi:MAG: bifunctional diguanylate cyclase/phosphodiesterase [Pseudomonadota bacterium]